MRPPALRPAQDSTAPGIMVPSGATAKLASRTARPQPRLRQLAAASVASVACASATFVAATGSHSLSLPPTTFPVQAFLDFVCVAIWRVHQPKFTNAILPSAHTEKSDDIRGDGWLFRRRDTELPCLLPGFYCVKI